MSNVPSDMLFCCPFCKQQLKAPHEYVGETAECPACQKEIAVPSSISGDREKPVFLDQSNVRWRWMRRVFIALNFAVIVSLVCLSISIAVNPVLPSLGFIDADTELKARPPLLPPKANKSVMDQGAAGEPRWRPVNAGARTEFENQRRRFPGAPWREGMAQGKENYRQNSSSVTNDKPLTMAFYVTWDSASLSSLTQNMDRLDIVIPEWLQLVKGSKLELLKPEQQLEVIRMMSSSPNGPKLVPMLTNRGDKGCPGEETGALLATSSGRANIIAGLVEYTRDFSVYGFCVHFENIPAKLMPGYLTFLTELAERIHKDNKVLYVCVPMEFPPAFCRRIALAADMVIVMAYSQHSVPAEPGPLAAQDWFERMIRHRAEEIPQSKLGIAFGSYACDWQENAQEVESITYDKAIMTAREQRAIVQMDQVSLNPAFRYKDNKNQQHDIWMLDAVTAFNQVAAAKKLKPRGIALWRLGSEDATLWRFYGTTNTLDAEMCAMLSDMEFKSGINFTGKGEIIRVAATPANGKRRLMFDERRGLIVECDYDSLPASYVVGQYGAVPKKIALTFDDGPDPAYTGSILDILKKEQVKATFFVIGSRAGLYPDLLRRMENEGHEIGLHTFTHLSIKKITPGQLERELSAAQRMLEGLLGRQTLLFRPPYGEGTDPSTADDMQVLEIIGRLGYWTVGMHIDPCDWQSLPAAEIVRSTIKQVRAGDGNIVLLHDSGGDRSATVAALPDLITELRGLDYKLVPVSELLGCTRDEVMPALAGTQQVSATLNSLVFRVARALYGSLTMLFMLGIVLGLVRLFFIGLLAIVDVWRKRRIYYSCSYKPSVAVIVPGYNEEKVICQTINSLLKSKCPYPLEIIVVDDGSRDQTYTRVFNEFGRHPVVRIFKKDNSGKAAALNFGISQTKAEIVVAMDADTVFARDTIWKLVRHFDCASVGAVAGNAKVGNRINMLTKWQALEYIASQNLDRRAFDVLDCITVVPGAVGAWRRELVVKAGGFGMATLAEDADLTIAIRRMGYSIVNDDEACAYTEAPDTISGFVKQRYRWMYGTMQAAWKHKRALFNPRYGALGFVALPNIIIFQVLFPLISPAIDLLTICVLGSYAWGLLTGVGSINTLVMVLSYYMLFTAVDFAVVMLAFALEPKEDKRLLWWLFPQRFCYRQLMYYVAVKSVLAALRGMEVGWGSLKRKATVEHDKTIEPPGK